MGSIRLRRTAIWLSIGYALTIASGLFLMLDGLRPGTALILAPWMAGPVGLAAIGVRKSRTIHGAYGFMTLQLLVIGSTVIAWAGMISVHLDALNGVAMAVVLPLYQYGAVTALWCAAYLFAPRGSGNAGSSDLPDR